MADGHERIQRRHGFLKHHAHVAAANLLQLPLPAARQRLALQAYFALQMSPGRQKLQDRQRRHGLSGS
jgi:hypothetical protein